MRDEEKLQFSPPIAVSLCLSAMAGFGMVIAAIGMKNLL